MDEYCCTQRHCMYWMPGCHAFFCTPSPWTPPHSPMLYAPSGNSPYILWCLGASVVAETWLLWWYPAISNKNKTKRYGYISPVNPLRALTYHAWQKRLKSSQEAILWCKMTRVAVVAKAWLFWSFASLLQFDWRTRKGFFSPHLFAVHFTQSIATVKHHELLTCPKADNSYGTRCRQEQLAVC